MTTKQKMPKIMIKRKKPKTTFNKANPPKG